MSAEPLLQPGEQLRDLLARGDERLFLDGAMGTELLRRGVPTPLPLWSGPANVQQPAKVEAIHHDYVRAGCRLITTNTFRTSLYAMEKAGKREAWNLWNRQAVTHARRAAGNVAWVLGSITTLEDCYRPDRVPPREIQIKYHRAQASKLAQCGVDGLLLETFNTLQELDSAYQAATEHNLPAIVSVVLKSGGELYDGTPLLEYARWADKHSPDAVCVNCASPEILDEALRVLRERVDRPLGVYANVGKPGGEMGFEFTHAYSRVDYASWVSRWAKLGVRIIGGCCGTTPEYMRAASLVADAPRISSGC